MPIAHYGINLRFVQEVDFKLLEPVNSAREAVSQLDALPCDVLIVDYTLSRDESDGCALLRRIAQHSPATRVLVWATNASSAYCTLARLAGARGFLSKSHGDLQDLVDAVRAVASGRTYVPKRFKADTEARDHFEVDPVVTSSTVANTAQDVERRTDGACGLSFEAFAVQLLSRREIEVLRCCLDGLSIAEVAQKFQRSVKTISTQKNSAYRKLGVRSDRELFKIATSMA